MNSMILRTFATAAIGWATAVAVPAHAMTLKNCTSSAIRAVAQQIEETGAKPAGSGALAANESLKFGTDRVSYLVTIMGQRRGRDVPLLIRNGLGGDGEFTVHASGAIWSFRRGSDCLTSQQLGDGEPAGAAGAAEDYPLATLMPDAGIWVGKPNPPLRLRNFTGHSIEIGPSAGDAWATYTLVGRDRYEDRAGNVFVMISRFSGTKNGVPYRYSWLE